MFIALLLGWAATATAEEPAAEPPRHRLFLENLTATRINPLGLLQFTTLSYRLKLFDSDSVVLGDTWLMVGPTVGLSPAFAKPGIRVGLKPTALTELQATYQFQQFFGTFDQVLGDDDPTFDWSDTNQSAEGDRAVAASGGLLTLQGRLQFAAGPVAARYTMRAQRHDLNVDEAYFYDQTPDMWVPTAGWHAVHDTDAIWLAGDLKAGLRWTYTSPFMGNGAGSEGNDSHRIGPLVTYTFSDRTGTGFAHPTLILIAQVHAAHRFRTGQDVPTALPYTALAFQFDGDLVPFD